jgi:hypothetical protein
MSHVSLFIRIPPRERHEQHFVPAPAQQPDVKFIWAAGTLISAALCLMALRLGGVL